MKELRASWKKVRELLSSFFVSSFDRKVRDIQACVLFFSGFPSFD